MPMAWCLYGSNFSPTGFTSLSAFFSKADISCFSVNSTPDLKLFRAAVKPVYDQYGPKYGSLIESIQKFRLATTGVTLGEPKPLGLEYIQMVQAGVVAAQYIQTWFDQPEDSVFIAPAYTFLMSNRPVSYQFWLDIGSQGWWERRYQPLTHPFILRRHWIPGQVWTDAHEFETNQRLLTRLVSGLILRCRQGIFLCFLGVNEQGREQRGLLLTALQNIQRRLPPEEVQRV